MTSRGCSCRLLRVVRACVRACLCVFVVFLTQPLDDKFLMLSKVEYGSASNLFDPRLLFAFYTPRLSARPLLTPKGSASPPPPPPPGAGGGGRAAGGGPPVQAGVGGGGDAEPFSVSSGLAESLGV